MGDQSFSVTVLGCDGSFPGPGGACSGYLVRGGGTTVWLDAGSGTMANLQRHVSLRDLDAVVITHEHPDHWTDLEGLAIAFKWGLRAAGPAVYAPDGLRSLMRVGTADEVFEWSVIDETSAVRVGALGLSFSRTDHPVPTFAVRVDHGERSLGYSADSGPGWGLSSLGPGLHLALCEATFLSDQEGTVQHMSARQAGACAAEAGVSKLVITHLTAGVDRASAIAEASASFGSEVGIARIDARFEI